MFTTEMDQIVEQQLERCKLVLTIKAKEYATQDRLHNFRVAADLQGITTKSALAGMMAKHTISIYDMCKDDAHFDFALWTEKITDHMNYLLLLQAIVVEEELEREKK